MYIQYNNLCIYIYIEREREQRVRVKQTDNNNNTHNLDKCVVCILAVANCAIVELSNSLVDCRCVIY